MRLQRKHLSLVIIGQAACVAVGLWMQHNLLRFSMRDAAQQEAWSEMQAGTVALRDELEALELPGPGSDPGAFQRVRELLRQKQARHCQVTIVDGQWRTVIQDPGEDQQDASALAAGEPVSWAPSSDRAHGRTGPVRGMLHTPDGPHIAVACTLADGAGHLLLHRPAEEAQAGAAVFMRRLLPVGMVTLLWTVALLSTSAYLAVRHYSETLDWERTRSSSDMLRRTQSLIRTRDAVIFALAKLAGSRDYETGGHLERMSDYATLLASALRGHPKFSQRVTPAFVRLIGLSSVLHDIGKVGIEDSILRKPGRLTPAERQRMQLHTVIAGNCLGEITQHLGNSNFLEMAREIAVAHHERWDGAGYPHGLKGEAIPLAARIVAIADVYDALSTVRVYKDPVPHEECVAIIRDGAGTQFDPDLVEVWLTIEPNFREINSRFLNSIANDERSRFHATAWKTDGDELGEQTKPGPEPADEDTHAVAESRASS